MHAAGRRAALPGLGAAPRGGAGRERRRAGVGFSRTWRSWGGPASCAATLGWRWSAWDDRVGRTAPCRPGSRSGRRRAARVRAEALAARPGGQPAGLPAHGGGVLGHGPRVRARWEARAGARPSSTCRSARSCSVAGSRRGARCSTPRSRTQGPVPSTASPRAAGRCSRSPTAACSGWRSGPGAASCARRSRRSRRFMRTSCRRSWPGGCPGRSRAARRGSPSGRSSRCSRAPLHPGRSRASASTSWSPCSRWAAEPAASLSAAAEVVAQASAAAAERVMRDRRATRRRPGLGPARLRPR